MLETSGVSYDDVESNPEAAFKALKFQERMMNQQMGKKLPQPQKVPQRGRGFPQRRPRVRMRGGPQRGGAQGTRPQSPGGAPRSRGRPRAPPPKPNYAPPTKPGAQQPLPQTGRKPTLAEVVSPENPTLRYKNLKECGRGTSGRVYMADDTQTKEKVAIKEMILEDQPDKDIIINEILLMRTCKHRGIVNFLDSYLHGGALWVVMEFVDGCDLTKLIDVCHPCKEPHIAAITHEVLAGLEHLHQRNIIHRDIKSDNVMVSHDGKVKLTDFGYGAQLTAEQAKRQTVVGTPYWMAPEVIQDDSQYDTSADIWSTGVMCIEMIDGLPPYMDGGIPPLRALFLIVSQGLPPPRNIKWMSEDFKDFVNKCTDVDPTKRPTATQLLKHPFITKNAQQGLKDIPDLVRQSTGK